MINKNEISLEPFRKSLDRLSEVLREPKTIQARDSALKRFEITLELSWKTLKKALEAEGVALEPPSPRKTIQTAFQMGWVEDEEVWLNALTARNIIVHLYSEDEADRVYTHLPTYHKILEKLFFKLKAHLNA